MAHVDAARIAEQAEQHLGEDGAGGTCVSNGLNRWTTELGLLPLPTAWVDEAEQLARDGVNGWRYVEGTRGVKVGNFLDWSAAGLGVDQLSRDNRHVSVLADVDDFGRFRSIGSGGPTGKVAYQPRGGGYNPPALFRGYWVAPTEAKAAEPAPAAAPAAAPAPKAKPKTGAVSTSSGKVYTVKAGDMLGRIARANGTTVPKLLALNPRAHNGHSADYAIRDANHIEVGQRIRLP